MNPSGAEARLTTVRARTLLPALLTAAVFALASCGGDDDADDSGSGGSSDNPAETILADAGLQVCGEAEEQYVQSIGDEGAQNVRGFAVAKDCGGSNTSPDTITIIQFDSLESRDKAASAIGTDHPRTVVMTSGALVLVSAGPNRQENADAVGKAYMDSTGEPVETV